MVFKSINNWCLPQWKKYFYASSINHIYNQQIWLIWISISQSYDVFSYLLLLHMLNIHAKMQNTYHTLYICLWLHDVCICVYVYICVCVCAQLSPTLCDPMDCSPPGSSVHGVFPARILVWVFISLSGGSSPSRNQNLISCISCITGKFFTHWAMGKALNMCIYK